MSNRIEEDPTGFVTAVKLTLYALVGVAVGAGWQPDFDVAVVVLIPLVAAVEGWTFFFVRAKVTPEVRARRRVEAATEAGRVEGKEAAATSLLELDEARKASRRR